MIYCHAKLTKCLTSFVDLVKIPCAYMHVCLPLHYKSTGSLSSSWSCASSSPHIQREMIFPKASTRKRLQEQFLHKFYCAEMTIACIFSTSENLFMYPLLPQPIIKLMFLSVMQNKSWEKTVALTRIFRGKKEKNKKNMFFIFLHFPGWLVMSNSVSHIWLGDFMTPRHKATWLMHLNPMRCKMTPPLGNLKQCSFQKA